MKAALILLIFLSGTCFVYAQKPQKYDGCMFGPRVDTTCGEVTVNLYGENKGMISIETKAGTRTKSNGEISVQKTSGKMSYPAGLVNIKIGTTYYYFKDVEESYDKKRTGLALQEYYMQGKMGIYLLAGKNGDSSFYIKLDEIQPIMNLSHPWFDVIDLVTIWACPAIGKRIDAQEDGLYYPPQAGMQQKMVVWKKIIDEAANCPKKQPAAR